MTLWYDKRYHTLNYELKETFKSKVIKLSLNGDFTCPNRDGSLDTMGCVFCSEDGAGDFAASSHLPISEQIESQIELLKNKWPKGKYISYFQNFSGTYGDIKKLRRIYYEALENDNVVGLAIATRPDCLSKEVLDLLNEINNKTYLWIELGLQTIHNETALKINRHFPLATFDSAIENLKGLNIRVVVHLIFGLFNETKEDILDSVRYVSAKNIYGVKFHLLHVMENTELANIFETEKFHILGREEYISLIVDALEILSEDIVVHRLTGDSPWKTLIEPKWSTDKIGVLNDIDKELKRRDSYQGIKNNK